jgi:LacI family transcriptional regulator
MAKRAKARLVDVARDAGVSPATVSRAMAQPDLLTPDTLARVHDSARKLGYRPDGMARALASGRTMTIGAIVPTLDSTIFARVLQAIQSALAREGYQLLVASHEMNPAAETEAVRTLLTRGVDGLMLVGAERSQDAAMLLRTAGVPVVLSWVGTPDCAAVTVDNRLAGHHAARHLIALGHRRIGMVVGHLPFNDRQQARLAGARQALHEAGLDLPGALVSEQGLTMAGGRAGCARLLELGEPPSAIIGGIDLFAIGCIQEAQSRGITVPEALSVVGIDGIAIGEDLTPQLSTVVQPNREIGRRCVELLIAALAREAAPTQADSLSLPAFLREGESCTRAPARVATAPRQPTAGHRPMPAATPPHPTDTRGKRR